MPYQVYGRMSLLGCLQPNKKSISRKPIKMTIFGEYLLCNLPLNTAASFSSSSLRRFGFACFRRDIFALMRFINSFMIQIFRGKSERISQQNYYRTMQSVTSSKKFHHFFKTVRANICFLCSLVEVNQAIFAWSFQTLIIMISVWVSVKYQSPIWRYNLGVCTPALNI